MDSVIFLVLGLTLVLLSVLLLIQRLRGQAFAAGMTLLVPMVALAAVLFVFGVVTARWWNAATFGCLTVSYALMIVQARQASRSA